MGIHAIGNVRFLLPLPCQFECYIDDDMSRSHTPNTPRSRSRSKRSSTNLSGLRLAPLSSKFADPQEQPHAQKSPYEEPPDVVFARQHPSYLQGKSAPTTPGILSRSSSRRHLGGGLSRKSSTYDDDDDYGGDDEVSYSYAPPVRVYGNYEGHPADMGSGQIPKAKSESVLLVQQRQQQLAGQGTARQHRRNKSHRSGTTTPRGDTAHVIVQDDWLTHTGAMASALVQEGKGQTWLANRASSTSLVVPESEGDDDDDDDQYEELAALSASTAKLHLASFEGGSPVSTRVSRWGSRYGSRSASRRTSRIASPVGTRTPRRGDAPGYFDDYQPELPTEEPDFVKPEDRKDDYQDQMDVERLTATNSFGLGNVVDRIMNFNLFKVEEGQETTDDETAPQVVMKDDESPEEAKRRMSAEMKRRREEKEKLISQPPPTALGGGNEAPGEGGGWKDAAWLLSVASKAMF